MRTISTLAAIALALSSGAAFAQAGPGKTMSSSPATAPQHQYAPQPMPEQYRNQAEGAQRTFSTGNTDNPRSVAITDEYGNQYNSRGERIGHGQRPR